MQESESMDLATNLDVSEPRKWPIFTGLVSLLIAGLSVLWFSWLSSLDNGLLILYKAGFFSTLAICVVALIVYRDSVAFHPEKPFLVILLAITCTSSWVYDTNEVTWDLESHFLFTLSYSDLDRDYEFSEAADSIETRIFDFSDYDAEKTKVIEEAIKSPEGSIDFESIHILLDTNALRARDDVMNSLDSVEDDQQKVAHGSLSNIYRCVSSMPSSFIFGFGGLIGLPFALRFVLAKLIYALMYSLILYFGMKKLKSGKLLFAVISLYPTAIFLASNYSYDFWMNAWCMFSVAGIIGQLQTPDEKIRARDMVGILGGFFLGLAPKAVYFPLVALALLIPKAKFSSKGTSRGFRISTCLVMLLVLCSFLLPFLAASPAAAGDVRGGSDVNSGGQIAFILSNPFEYAGIFLAFLWDYLSIPHTMNYIVLAAYLGQGSVIIWAVIFALTLFTTVADTKANTHWMDRWPVRLFVIVIVLFILLLAITAIYISYNPVGLSTVRGFQGRYMLPLLFPLLAFMGTRRTYWPRAPKLERPVALGVLAVMLLMNYWFLWDMYVGLLN